MEEDTEVLDWGNEDDEQQVQGSHGSHHLQKRSDARDDAEDAVSLGGDDDDLQDFSAYQSRPERDVEKIQPLSSKRVSTPQPQQNSQNKRDLQREHSGSTQISSRQAESPQLGRSQSLSMTKLTHALPPKPVLVVPDVVPSPPHASTLASSMVHRDRRSNGLGRGKSASVEAGDRLPADWEIRHPRGGGREAYYYNVKTHESTWTRPDGTGRVSPTKDRDSVARSPLRGVDDGTRSQGLARVAPRKEPKRQVSPAPNLDGLSYEDRHYRPGDSSNSMNTGDRKEERAPRPQLPRTLDDRRPRSVTPPRRDVHLRRGLSRSPSPVNDTWRGARDEFRSRSPVPDRTRGRPRKEDTRSPSPEIRPSRGRRQRADIEPPLAQDQAIRRGISREWPAHRHRSPPSHPREPSPVNLRRIADSWEPSPTTAAPTTKRKNRNDRSPSPVSKRPISRRDEYTADSYVSDAYVRQTEDAYAPRQVDDSYVPRSTGDVYVPADLIPQRRGRDQDHVIENENEAKRRRVDDRPTESSPSVRRIPLPDRAELATPNSLPQRPSSTQESDQPRRKRQPLPPQSTRFKEASKFPSTPAIPPPAPTLPPAPSRPRESQDARFLNGPINVYADVPSGPRSKTKGLQGDLMPRVPSKAYPAPPIVAPTQQEPRAMDVDYPQPVRSQPPRRPDDSLARSTSSTHLDRQVSDMQSESIPKGPRAMTKMNMPGGYGPPASFPPAPTSKGTPEPSRSPAAMRGRPLQGRPPPPHMAANPDVWPHRRESIPTGPGTPGAAPQRFEDTRDTAPGGPSKRRLSSARESMASKPADVRESSERPLRRIAPTPSAPAMKLSGTNNIPIGTRRTAPVTEQPLAAPLRPAERFRSTPGLPPPDRLEIKTRFPETWVNVSQESSPGDRYRNLLPESERRRVSESSRDAPESSSRIPQPEFRAVQLSVNPLRESWIGQGDRPTRPTRFGPEPSQTSPTNSDPPEQRLWVTRQESLEGSNRPGRPASDGPSLRSQGPSSTSSWNGEDSRRRDGGVARATDQPSNDEYLRWPRRDHTPDTPEYAALSEKSHYPETQTLEGRLSSVYTPRDSSARSVPQHGGADIERARVTSGPGHPQPGRGSPATPPHYEASRGRGRSPSPTNYSLTSSVHVHPAHAAFVERFSLPPIPRPDILKASKPIRIKRSQNRDEFDDGRQGGGYHDNVERSLDESQQRPLVRRGGSLLDRLQLDSPSSGMSSPPTSLRHRVDGSVKRPNEDSIGAHSTPIVATNNQEGLDITTEGASRTARGRKRSGKPRRGRRNGAPS